MSDNSECNCEQALALKERIAELERRVLDIPHLEARIHELQDPNHYDSPAAAERARIVAYIRSQASSKYSCRRGCEDDMAEDIEKCAHLPSATGED
jgi:hypothetical protein